MPFNFNLTAEVVDHEKTSDVKEVEHEFRDKLDALVKEMHDHEHVHVTSAQWAGSDSQARELDGSLHQQRRGSGSGSSGSSKGK